MIKFDTYRLLNEALGFYSLGVATPQNLGLASNLPGIGEAGLDFGAKKKPKTDDLGGSEIPMGPDDEEGGEEGDDAMGAPEGGEIDDMGDEMGGGEDDMGMGGEEGGLGGGDDLEARIAELEAEIEKLKTQLGGGEEDDMEFDDLDHEDDLGGEDEDGEGPEGIDDLDSMGDDDEMGGDEDDAEDEDGKKKPPMFGRTGGAFMSKEGKGSHKKEKEEKDDGDGEFKKEGKGKDNLPSFLMKKKCSDGMDMKKKKCDSGMDKGKGELILGKCKGCKKGAKKCKGCSAKMKKENAEYGRPKGYDASEDAFWRSIKAQLASQNVNQKFDDGMRNFKNEDLLLAPPGGGLEGAPSVTSPGPGEIGYAPSGRLGGDFEITGESVQNIMKRLDRLEKGN
jgi:hypothetical protein